MKCFQTWLLIWLIKLFELWEEVCIRTEVSITRPARGTCAARGLFHKFQKCSLLIILAIFGSYFRFYSYQCQLLFKLSHFNVDLAYYATSLDFGLFDAARRSFSSLICGPGPWRHISSQFGPCIVLSLRPLF